MLPYDVINKIFDYISQMNDSKRRLTIDFHGVLSFRLNVWFSGYASIHQVNTFKQGFKASQVRIRLNVEDSHQDVDALVEPRRICHQDAANNDADRGFINQACCYTYSDPATGENRHAYIVCRHYFNDNHIEFYCGEVLSPNGDARRITGYGTDESGIVNLTVSSMDLWWEIDNDPDLMDMAQALLELGDDDDDMNEIDLQPLEMYM